MHSVTSRGLGASVARKPNKVARLISAMKRNTDLPISVKLRSGWGEDKPNAVRVARLAEDAGASCIFIHARSREDRYRKDADWNLIAEIVQAVSIPVIGSGDLAHGPQALTCKRESGCAGLALARGALIKPWIFNELAQDKLLDPDSMDRLKIFKLLVEYTLERFGDDEFGLKRSKEFLALQFEFLARYIPVGAFGRPVGLQERVNKWEPRDELEDLMSQRDEDSFLELLERSGFPNLNSVR